METPLESLQAKLSKIRFSTLSTKSKITELSAPNLVNIYYALSERWDPELCDADAVKTKSKFLCVKLAMRSMDCMHFLPTIKQLKAVKTDRKAQSQVMRGLNEMICKLETKYDDFYTRPANDWPKAQSKSKRAQPVKKPMHATYTGYNLPEDIGLNSIPESGSAFGDKTFKPATEVTAPFPSNSSKPFVLSTPNPNPFPRKMDIKHSPTLSAQSSLLSKATPATQLSSDLSALSLKGMGTKRVREECQPPTRKRQSLDSTPPRNDTIVQKYETEPSSQSTIMSVEPTPSPPPEMLGDSTSRFQEALQQIKLEYCGQTIELCGLSSLRKSVYFPQIYKLFNSLFGRLQDYDVQRVEEGARLLWHINRPLEVEKWKLLRMKVQKLYSAVCAAIPPDLDAETQASLLDRKDVVTIRDKDF